MAYRGLGIEWSGSYSFGGGGGGGSGSGTDGGASAGASAAGRDAGRAFGGSSGGPAFPVLDPNAPGMGPGTVKMTTGRAAYKPTCMTAAQALAFGPCFTHVPPKGMTSAQLATLCGNANAAGLVDLPYCPDAQRGKIPGCLDQGWVDTLTYCDRWPSFNGPKPLVNGICWAAKKDPSWYAQVKAVPWCEGTKLRLNVGPTAQFDVPLDAAALVESPSNTGKYMMYAGIGLLGLVVVAAGYSATRKH